MPGTAQAANGDDRRGTARDDGAWALAARPTAFPPGISDLAPRARNQAATRRSPRRPVRVLFVSHSLPRADRPLENLGGMQRMAQEQAAWLGSHPDVRLRALVLESSYGWCQLRTPLFVARLLSRIPRLVSHLAGLAGRHAFVTHPPSGRQVLHG